MRDVLGKFIAGHETRKRTSVKTNCSLCGNSFMVQPHRFKNGRGKFCSEKCRRTGIFTEEVLEKMSKAKRGNRSPTWKGGISKNPYPRQFNAKLKLKIRTRDNFICCLCGMTEREQLEELNRVLCVNHIDFDKSNLKESNLNTLCLRCNTKINRERDYWTNYFSQ